ncbi:MAG: YitT family protein [Clostridia bacterium]|nr:YitT family protein [Clostridia bacterium]
MKGKNEILKSIPLTTIGSFILALGINVFLSPNKISSGGISAIGTILIHLFGIKISITNTILNLVLLLLGIKILGRKAILKTIIGIASLSLFLEITSYLPSYTEDTMLSSIVGGVLVGIGVGLVVRQHASTGGSDLLAFLIKRFIPHLSLARIILIIDTLVIITSGIVFKSITITIYSVIAMYISSVVTDEIMTFGNKAKSVQIFSSKNEEIASMVLERLNRGVTGIKYKGMYSKREGTMLLCIVSPRELPSLLNQVKQIDKGAFIIINDARQVLGEGFSSELEY